MASEIEGSGSQPANTEVESKGSEADAKADITSDVLPDMKAQATGDGHKEQASGHTAKLCTEPRLGFQSKEQTNNQLLAVREEQPASASLE